MFILLNMVVIITTETIVENPNNDDNNETTAVTMTTVSSQCCCNMMSDFVAEQHLLQHMHRLPHCTEDNVAAAWWAVLWREQDLLTDSHSQQLALKPVVYIRCCLHYDTMNWQSILWLNQILCREQDLLEDTRSWRFTLEQCEPFAPGLIQSGSRLLGLGSKGGCNCIC